jgi:hypothetical protein
MGRTTDPGQACLRNILHFALVRRRKRSCLRPRSLSFRRDRRTAPVRSELLARPLEFIVAEHHRLRDLCRLLDGIAEAPGSATIPADAILHCIEHELPLHHRRGGGLVSADPPARRPRDGASGCSDCSQTCRG